MKGTAIVANQEMILRFAWINEEERKKVFIETAAIEDTSVTPQLERFPPVRDSTTFKMTKGFKVPSFEPPYIGKDEIESSMPAIFIFWNGSDQWKEDMEGSIYWSPAALNIPVYKAPGSDKDWVRLEDIL